MPLRLFNALIAYQRNFISKFLYNRWLVRMLTAAVIHNSPTADGDQNGDGDGGVIVEKGTLCDRKEGNFADVLNAWLGCLWRLHYWGCYYTSKRTHAYIHTYVHTDKPINQPTDRPHPTYVQQLQREYTLSRSFAVDCLLICFGWLASVPSLQIKSTCVQTCIPKSKSQKKIYSHLYSYCLVVAFPQTLCPCHNAHRTSHFVCLCCQAVNAVNTLLMRCTPSRLLLLAVCQLNSVGLPQSAEPNRHLTARLQFSSL